MTTSPKQLERLKQAYWAIRDATFVDFDRGGIFLYNLTVGEFAEVERWANICGYTNTFGDRERRIEAFYDYVKTHAVAHGWDAEY